MVSQDDAIFCLVSSVLSDTNKRFLYDVGVYDSDDDQNVSLLFVDLYGIIYLPVFKIGVIAESTDIESKKVSRQRLVCGENLKKKPFVVSTNYIFFI